MKTLEQVLADTRGEIPDAEIWRRVVRNQLDAPRDPWFTVYALFDSRDPRRVRYIGVSRSAARRYAEHALRPGHQVAVWVHSLREAGVRVGMRVLRRYARGVDAFQSEARLIALQIAIGGCDLNTQHASFLWAMERPVEFAGWPTPPAWAMEVVR